VPTLFRGQPIVDFYRFVDALVVSHIPAGAAVLDVGCGDGRFTEKIIEQCRPARIVGIDTDADAVRAAKSRLSAHVGAEFFQGDGEDIEFLKTLGEFTVINSRLTIHHLNDPLRALKMWADLLPPGGALIIVDIDRDSYCYEVAGCSLSTLLTWVSVIRSSGVRVGVRAIRGMQYGSEAWKEHRRKDMAHRQAIGWYRFCDIRRKFLALFPTALTGRSGGFGGIGGVHYMVYKKADVQGS